MVIFRLCSSKMKKGGIIMPIKDPEKKREAQQRANAKRDDHHTWEFVVFTESLAIVNPNWLDDISEHPEQRQKTAGAPLTLSAIGRRLGYELYVSPLHVDSDQLHRHIVVHHNNKISMNQALQVAELLTLPDESGSLIGIPYEAFPKTLSGALRYGCHLDDRDKKQYSPNDFVIINNSDPLPKIRFTTEEKLQYIKRLFNIIDKEKIKSLQHLSNWLSSRDDRILQFMLQKTSVQSKIQAHFNAQLEMNKILLLHQLTKAVCGDEFVEPESYINIYALRNFKNKTKK